MKQLSDLRIVHIQEYDVRAMEGNGPLWTRDERGSLPTPFTGQCSLKTQGNYEAIMR